MSARRENGKGKDRRAARKDGQIRVLIAPDDAERAERLREVLDGLVEINRKVPIIVEGRKDAAALQSLGFEGEIITLHRGQNLYDFSEEIIGRYDKIVLMLDWDERGDQMTRALEESFKGYFEEFRPFRDTIRILCQKDIKDIEAIPTLLRRLEGSFAGKSAPWPEF
ncbi:MAG: toprim domain-containing protein [Nitrospiraceae bacterium]|nr:toprim domain-containing protein [Nitrospiraceae bacterium]